MADPRPTPHEDHGRSGDAAPILRPRLQDRLADLGRQSTAKDRATAAAVAGTTATTGANPWTSLMGPTSEPTSTCCRRDFGPDTFEPFEGFTGTEDTTVRSGSGLTGHVTLP